MDVDWGGQGPANMPSGNNCYQLGSDKCAQITGIWQQQQVVWVCLVWAQHSFNTIDISELDIENGESVQTTQ